MAYTGPLVQLEMSFTRLPWRIAPGWAVAAGAIAGGLSFVEPANILKLAGGVVLADIAWGMLRHYTAHPEPPPARAPALLPYATAASPAARLLAGLAVQGREDRAGWQGALVGLFLTATLSSALGWQAALCSFVALLLVWVAWVARGRGYTPAFADALLDVGVPGVVGVSLTGIALRPPPWPVLAGAAVFVALHWLYLRFAGPRLGQAAGRWVAALLWAGLIMAVAIYRL